ncbi:MAG: thiamine phosphate synthase [Mariprofundaceae bacterium]|nr:thiamine phosphate synthase [Mariprofundaceae bacterium]
MTGERKITGIYGILPADIRLEDLLEKAEAALKGGVQTLQLRDKKQGFKKGLKRAVLLRELTKKHGARLIVNDSLPLAVESAADGVHFGREDMQSLVQMRSQLATDMIIGISCKGDGALARHVLQDGADYVSFGAVFPTRSKLDAAPIGLPRLAKARQMFADANICAIGGITLESLPAVKKAGADCAAVISSLFNPSLFDAQNIEIQAQNMVETWNNAASA